MKLQNTVFMAVLLALAAYQASASTTITNGDFASGDFMPGWIKTGNAQVQGTAAVQSNNFGHIPPPAVNHAILGTGTVGADLLGGSAVPASALENFSGLTGGTLLANNQINCPTCTVGSGSAIQTIFTAAAGSQLSFNWNFFTNTDPRNVPQDMAFWVLDHDFHFLANTHSTLVYSDTASFETNYQNSFTALTSGLHTLSFGIVDGTPGGSALALTNVQLNAVPLPAACWLFLMGIVGLFKYSRQFKRA